MLRTVGDAPTLWESILPAAVLGMPAELEAVDRLLDDPRFFEPYRAVLPCVVGAAVDPDRDVPAADVLEVPLQAGLRAVVSGGGGLDHLAAVLSDPARWGDAASDDVDEDHEPLRRARDRRVERRVVGEGGRGAGAQDEPGARRTPRWSKRTSRIRSDSSLLAKGVARLAKLTAASACARSGCAGHRCGTGPVRCIGGPVDVREHVASTRRRRAGPGCIDSTRELADIARRAVRDAEAVIRNARRRVRELGDASDRHANGRSSTISPRCRSALGRVAAQTRQRVVEGVTPAGRDAGRVAA